jgi:hypothetical protein
LANDLRSVRDRAAVADRTVSGAVPSFDRKFVLMAIFMVAIRAGIVAIVPSALSGIFNLFAQPATGAQTLAIVPPTVRVIFPYWSLSALNLVVLFGLAATLIVLDRRSAAGRAFVVALVLRGIVGVTATLGDGASFAIAHWAVPFDATTSTLLSGALTIFVLLYPRRRPWAGPLVLGTIAVATLAFAAAPLVAPATLGVFTRGANGRLAVVSTGPLLSERGWYIDAIGFAGAILAIEHARLTRAALRDRCSSLCIGLVVFPIFLGVTLAALGSVGARSVFVRYSDAAFGLLVLSLAAALMAAAIFAATELRRGHLRLRLRSRRDDRSQRRQPVAGIRDGSYRGGAPAPRARSTPAPGRMPRQRGASPRRAIRVRRRRRGGSTCISRPPSSCWPTYS